MKRFNQYNCLFLAARLSLAVLCFLFLAVEARSQFLQDSELRVDLNAYGRYRDSNQNSRDIEVIAAGFGLGFKSGYAGFIGADAALYSNIGTGNGMSEILKYDYNKNKDSNIIDFNIAAVKMRFAGEGLQFDVRAGYTPVNVGTIGTSSGLHSHSYRGMEARLMIDNKLELSYGLADRFNPEWEEGMRRMRDAAHGDERINFIHSTGVKYIFGIKDDAYVDVGFGHGWNYRINGQAAILYPVHFARGSLDFLGYLHLGRYTGGSDYANPTNEYHLGGSMTFNYTDFFSFKLAQSYTKAPDSGEMNFRLTSWGYSDNRNFIQSAAQLDDFVWDGEKATQLAFTLYFDKMNVPGLEMGLSYTRGWNKAYEFDYYAYYEWQQGPLTGLNAGIYLGRLRWDNNFKNEDDIKGIVGYSYTFN